MNTIGTPLLWIGFVIIMVIMLIIDLLIQRNGINMCHISLKKAVTWCIGWITLAMFFCVILWRCLVSTKGHTVADFYALSFLNGYLIEKALALDNVFVWLVLFNYFDIPILLQRRILVYGVLGAVILRTIMVFFGSYLISQFKWSLYVLGIFLFLAGINMVFSREESYIGKNQLLQWLYAHLRITTVNDDHFFIRKNGLLYATQLFLVLVLVELSDVIFAVDSIPAVFAITTDPFIVLTSNIFAMLGLRAMYFLFSNIDVMECFSNLKYGLSAILIFVGVKMTITNFYRISVSVSLSIMLSIIILTLIFICINRNSEKDNN